MEEERIVVGIDIGTTKVVCLIAKKSSNGNIEIIGRGETASVGVMKGDVVNVTRTAESIKVAVQQAEKQANYQVQDVFVGIAGFNVKSDTHRAFKVFDSEDHLVTDEDIESMINNDCKVRLEPGIEVIDIIPQYFLCDSDQHEYSPDMIVGVITKKIECVYKYVSADTKNINNIKRSVETAGYSVKDLILQPICSAEAVVTQTEKEAGVCLVDIGGGTTDVAIYHDGIVRYTSVIQLAGNVITADIAHSCMLMDRQAVVLKEKFGDCSIDEKEKENEIISVPGLRGQESKEISVATLSKVIHYRVSMILEQVLYDIQESGYEKKLIAGIILAGGGAMLKNIEQLTTYVTGGIPTRRGNADDYLVKSKISEGLGNPKYATVVGLLIKGFEYYKNHEPEPVPEPVPEPEPNPEQEQDIEPEPEISKKSKKKDGNRKSWYERFQEKIGRIITTSADEINE